MSFLKTYISTLASKEADFRVTFKSWTLTVTLTLDMYGMAPTPVRPCLFRLDTLKKTFKFHFRFLEHADHELSSPECSWYKKL